MSGYNYQKGGYTTRNEWDTRTDDWIQANYSGNGYSDHVHHPVIVDDQVRERPISESYVTQIETVIERVQVPVVTEYKYSSPTKVESFNDYKNKSDRWRWPKSTPVVQDRPQKVEAYVQTPSPTKFTPNSTGYNGNEGYGGYKNFSNSEKPDDYYRNRSDTFSNPTLTNKDGRDRPGSKGWGMQPPSTPLSKPTNDIGMAVEFLKEAVISTTQPRFGIPVSAVPKKDPYTETIGVGYPQRGVKPATVTFTEPPPSSTMTQKEPYGEIIDSREAPRQYASSNNSSTRPYKIEESHTGVMGSREVARKYGGTYV